jgi:myo-inositol-1(or 4)-monophosphatase
LTPDRWLAVSRAAVNDIRRVLVELPTRAEREPVVGTGMGGDETTTVDQAAEQAVVARLEAVHRTGVDFTLVSEELGERRFGEPTDLRVVLDPIDGSFNAKRGLPFFSVSLAVAQGDTLRDVVFGYVYDFGAGEEWTAVRRGGAWLAETRLGTVRPKDALELVALEATRTPSVAEASEGLTGLATRVRVLGSLALSLCHLAAGRLDGVCSLRAARAVDIAAAQLLVRECGLAIALPDDHTAFEDAPLDTARRSRVVAAATDETCARLAAALP